MLKNMKMKYGWRMLNLNMKTSTLRWSLRSDQGPLQAI